MTTYNIIRYFKGYIIKDVQADNEEQALEKFLAITDDYMDLVDSPPDVKLSWNEAVIEQLD